VDVRRRVSPEESPDAPPKSSNVGGVAAAAKPRYFEFVEGTSSKFWEVTHVGNIMTTRWGRIGSAGQSKAKTFADPQAAANAIAVLIEEKTDEGYVERPR
jgi:predicted DNA-binding WGR domain protein